MSQLILGCPKLIDYINVLYKLSQLILGCPGPGVHSAAPGLEGNRSIPG